jgi:hypothetical protein
MKISNTAKNFNNSPTKKPAGFNPEERLKELTKMMKKR